ncbi:hypothetical protein [Xylanimonas sp. McL0601]|uniref:hypothetical protein n=1 Tax=Xylanimonas sp. McL0601 TaxID=3414739 RepID=UPI003CFAB7C4
MAWPARALVAAGALALAGCSLQLGDAQEVPRYVAVEADGVHLDVLDGMAEAEVPSGFSRFWQTQTGTLDASIGIAPGAAPDAFVDAQLASLGEVMDDLDVHDAGDGAAFFEGTGVNGKTYTGIAAVRGTTGVVVSSGSGLAEAVLRHVVDSVTPAERG